MEVKTVVNSEALKEVKRYLLNPKAKIVLGIAILLFVISDVMYLMQKEYTMVIAVTAIIAGIILEEVLMEKKLISTNLKRIKETYNTDDIQGSVAFNDDEFIVKNEMSKGEASMKYDILAKMYETDKYFIIFTKSWQFININKDQFDDEMRKEFIDLLKKNALNLKMKIK